jgi:diaminopropionate ammonia-lyase
MRADAPAAAAPILAELRADNPDLLATLSRLQPSYVPTPLLDLARLAAECRVARVLVKDESRRPLGNFKSLGGAFAGLRALARAGGFAGVEALLASGRGADLPPLITASDGNHGLSAATAARLAGTAARIFLPASVPEERSARISATGAEVVRIDGTYDDAVDAAAAAARSGGGLLVPDTSERTSDPVLDDVMAGYGLMAREIAAQCRDLGARPTHLFVQAGVGGLAAAMAKALAELMPEPPAIVVVEPDAADCVRQGLRSGRPELVPGELHTSAEMLACGLASAHALAILREQEPKCVTVDEGRLGEAVTAMSVGGGPATTPSGACGLAGLLEAASDSALREELGLGAESAVLLIASEGVVPDTAA